MNNTTILINLYVPYNSRHKGIQNYGINFKTNIVINFVMLFSALIEFFPRPITITSSSEK